MKKTPLKKIMLAKETLLRLENRQVAQVKGGYTQFAGCTNSCFNSCPPTCDC